MHNFNRARFTIIAGFLGAALLTMPLTSQAAPGGKWWAGGGKGHGHGRGKGQVERGQDSRGGPSQQRLEQQGGRGQSSGQQGGRAQWSDRQATRGQGSDRQRGGAQQGGQAQWSERRQRGESQRFNRQSSGQESRRVAERQDVRVDQQRAYRAPVRSYSGGYSGSVTRDRGTSSYSGSVRYRGTPTYRAYRAPVWGGSRQFTGRRFYRSYGSVPVYRDYVAVSVHSQYRPVYGWRYYCPPAYYYPTHVVYVRPVRFFVAANFAIGGLGISASYADPGPVYGCNFCDARFSDYGDYEYHVEHCQNAPHGYQVIADQWDQSCVDQWQDDQVGDRRYEDYQGGYDDGDDLDR